MAKKVKPEKNTNKVLIPEVVTPLGRPTLYKPEYCQMLIDHMTEGYSFESFGGLITTTRDNLYHWCTIHEAFSYAKKIGRLRQLQHDEKTLDMMSKGMIQGGSAAALIFKMKNCHKWTDKQEIQINAQDTEKLLLEAQQALVELLADNSNKDKDE